MTTTPDIFAARAVIAETVSEHLGAIVTAISEAQTPTEDFPGGLFPDGLTAVLSQVQVMAQYAVPMLTPPPPVEDPEI